PVRSQDDGMPSQAATATVSEARRGDELKFRNEPAPCGKRRSRVHRLGADDFNTETRQADIRRRPPRRNKSDRVDAEIFENLGAQPDLAPLPGARLAGRALRRFWN